MKNFYSICKKIKEVKFLYNCEVLKEFKKVFKAESSEQIKILVEALECFYPGDDSSYFKAIKVDNITFKPKKGKIQNKLLINAKKK